MEIVNVNDRCFLVLRHINIEKFSSQEKLDKYFENKVYLRKPDSPEVLIVHEIFDGLIESPIIPLELEHPIVDTGHNVDQPTAYEQSVPPGQMDDIKI
jgi:hypothetical protein